MENSRNNNIGNINIDAVNLQNLMQETADAIKEKLGNDNKIAPVNFPEKIKEISNGPLIPQQVYEERRPKDWLPMPKPNENEMYMLFEVPNRTDTYIAFTVDGVAVDTTVLPENFVYKIELGTTTGENGSAVFEAKKTETFKWSSNQGGWQRSISNIGSGWYGAPTLTSNNMAQVMIKLSIETPGGYISKWRPANYILHDQEIRYSWNIVEIACNLPEIEDFGMNNKPTTNVGLSSLRFFSMYGENKITSLEYVFYSCYSLEIVLELDTTKVTLMHSCFNGCQSLLAIPELDTSSVTDMSYCFNQCVSLENIPHLNTSKVINMGNMFSYSKIKEIPLLDTSQTQSMVNMFFSCQNLTSIPKLNTKKVTTMQGMFQGCFSLKSIPELDFSSVQNFTSTFENCRSLVELPPFNKSTPEKLDSMFKNCKALKRVVALNLNKAISLNNIFSNSGLQYCNITASSGWTGIDIPLQNVYYSFANFQQFLRTLPTISTTRTIDFTGNPFTYYPISDLQPYINTAASKGWTIKIN